MTVKLSELEEALVVNDTDTLYVVQGGVSKKAPKSLLSGGGGDPNIIWQWDGTLGDFTNGASPEVDESGAGVLSLETSWRNNPALRITAGAAGYSSWAVDPSALSVPLPRRYVLEYTIDEMGDGSGGYLPASQMGVSAFCQYNGSGDVLAYTIGGYGNLSNFRQIWTLNTVHGLSAGTPIWTPPGASTLRGCEYSVTVEHILGATFDMNLKTICHASGSYASRWFNDVNLLDFNGTTFDNQVPNTLGLVGFFTAAGHYTDFSRLTLLKHPADR